MSDYIEKYYAKLKASYQELTKDYPEPKPADPETERVREQEYRKMVAHERYLQGEHYSKFGQIEEGSRHGRGSAQEERHVGE